MDAQHLSKPDPRPKRRKDGDNPYTIYTVGIDTASPRYYVSFTDEFGQKNCCEVSKEVYQQFDIFDIFEKEDIRYMNEQERHYERSELSEITLERRSVGKQEDIEDIVSQRLEEAKLHQAIQELPQVQRDRLVSYYFHQETYQTIADKNGCTVMPVQRSITSAQKKIKKYFAKGG